MDDRKLQSSTLKGELCNHTETLRGRVVVPEIIRIDYSDQTYILVDDYGHEVTAVAADEPVVLDASSNDIRLGKTAATGEGLTVGDKEIPSYQTTSGWQGVPVGEEFSILIPHKNRYDYTKLQAILCPFNTAIASSVSTEKVVIEDKVYNSLSTEPISTVTIDHNDKSIKLGITNTGNIPFLIRYFTYKEEY